MQRHGEEDESDGAASNEESDEDPEADSEAFGSTSHVVFPFAWAGLFVGQRLVDGLFGGFEGGDGTGDCRQDDDDHQP